MTLIGFGPASQMSVPTRLIPSTRARAQAITYDKHIYQNRTLVERLSSTRASILVTSLHATRRMRYRSQPCYSEFGAMIWLR
jgi:hypothetical protein